MIYVDEEARNNDPALPFSVVAKVGTTLGIICNSLKQTLIVDSDGIDNDDLVFACSSTDM